MVRLLTLDEVKDLTKKYDGKDISTDDMYEYWQSLNKIAVLKEETFVVTRIFKGYTKKKILAELNKKHPDENITLKNLNEFLNLFKGEITKKANDIEKSYLKRILKTQEGLSNKLLDLANMTEKIAKMSLADDDNANAVQAVKAAADIFMKVGKMNGLFKDTPDINVNMKMDKIVTEISSNNSDFKKSIMNIVNGKDEVIVDADVVVENG